MQMILTPWPDIQKNICRLDLKRLKRQKVAIKKVINTLEGKSDYNAHHPAILMWENSLEWLKKYFNAICKELKYRAYPTGEEPYEIIEDLCFEPQWWGNWRFHLAQQSNLVKKDSVFYQRYFPSVPSNLPYIWPDMTGRIHKTTLWNSLLIDKKILPLVEWLNSIPTIETMFSCEGDVDSPIPVGKGFKYIVYLPAISFFAAKKGLKKVLQIIRKYEDTETYAHEITKNNDMYLRFINVSLTHKEVDKRPIHYFWDFKCQQSMLSFISFLKNNGEIL